MMKNEKQQPIFTENQLNSMSPRDMSQIILLMQKQQQDLKEKQKLMEEKMRELEFMNALLSDRLTLAQRKQFGASSEKYADGYVQMGLFNEAEQEQIQKFTNQKWRKYALPHISGGRRKERRKKIFQNFQLQKR